MKLGDICEINPKTKIQKDIKISFLPMKCVLNDGKGFITRQINSTASKGYTKFQNGDIIWAKITPCMENKKSAIVLNLQNGYGCGSTEFFVLRTDKSINKSFILLILQSDFLINQAKNTFKGSAGQQRVPKDFLSNFKIPLPPLEIQNEIVAHINELKSEIKTIQTKQEKLNLEVLSKNATIFG